jgi:signal transduction histidine kinase
VAVGILLGVTNLAIYASARVYLQAWLDGHLRTLAATEAASSTDGLEDVHLHERTFAQFDAGAFTEKLVQIFDANGQLVLQSTGLAGLPPVVSPADIAGALEGRVPLLSTTVQGRPLRVVVVRAAREDRPFAVAVGLFADGIEQGLDLLGAVLALAWLVSVAATATLGYVLAGRALAPVARITERAAWIAQGHFGARLEVPPSGDEVARMTVLLNSMLDRLQAAVEANRRFAADASHELRGPLTAMAGQIDVTLRHPRTADDYRETLGLVRSQLTALTRLAEDLILLVRAQEGAHDIVRRELDLRQVVVESFRRLEHEARARHITLRESGLETVRVYADPALLARVVDNVIANAVHYNRDGGEVVVTAAVDQPPDEGAWTSSMVDVRVRDTGAGIAPDQHERIFERFYRLDQSRARHTGGSGLGLAICREVLALHDGTIRVETSSGEGTVIAIRLPGARVGTAPV